MVYRHGLGALSAVLLGLLSHNAVRADQIFVTNGTSGGFVGEYNTAGATVNPALISGLSFPRGIAVSGSDLFVVNSDNGTIGKYTTGGATVNPALISGLSFPYAIAVSGSDLFVTNYFVADGSGTIGKYTTDGATVNPALISGLSGLAGIAVSGSDLFVTNYFVADYGSGTIGKYTTDGATVNPALISGLGDPIGIAVSGSHLFVVNHDVFIVDQYFRTIGEYTTAGATVNPVLISGLPYPFFIAVATVPEPRTCTLALFGLVLAGLAIKNIEKKWHSGGGWAYLSNDKTDIHGPHLPGLFVGGRPFAQLLAYGAALLIFMTAWAILLMYAA